MLEPPVNLDFNAGAPLDPRVAAAMRGLPPSADGNPQSPHRLGRAARALLEDARERIAESLGLAPLEVVFTSGGTEANNLAVATGCEQARALGRRFWCSPIEHPSVREPARHFAETGGLPAPLLGLSPAGEVLLPRASGAPAFVSLILAHHELGVVQDLEPFATLCHAGGGLLHSDASQALGRLPLGSALGLVDYLTLAPHKAGGPRGIGVLVAREGRPLSPLLRGGSQEFGRRPGTPSPRLAQGAARSVELALAETEARARRMDAGMRALLEALAPCAPRVLCEGAGQRMLPNTRLVSFAPVEARLLVPALDLAGCLVSYGSACSTGAREPSPALAALGLGPGEAACCLRVSLGESFCAEQAGRVGEVFAMVLARFKPRDASMSSRKGFDSAVGDG